jgi:hypothetical protein
MEKTERNTDWKIGDGIRKSVGFPIRLFHLFYPTDGADDDVDPIEETSHEDLQARISKLQAC